jgi:anti-anti-sigma factor
MRHHHPLHAGGAPASRRLAFQVRPCRRSLRRRACCPVLHLTGELDIAATPSLLVAVDGVLVLPSGRARPGGLVLDLGALTFCDAAGLTGLVRTRRLTDAAGVPLFVTAPPRRVSRILDVCGLQPSFPLHPSAVG